ncbi:STAS domain-containing protein [Cytobacillus spongiae]|jgi:anti-anti-sigma factor|uniref:STAS domain-containing protein n=1 Tax=Cytobacillus spongiae TaxID=2901381 RepID=UPI001F159DCD|nr:STAS domain-containing protein [Cytobacillus spongiae]UII56206.1 STAS domain-containing protein [Cytobacillus spongiae]
MNIEMLQEQEVMRAIFKTDIHFETSHQLNLELSDFQLPENTKKVEIDFKNVRFVDSSGISLLLKWIHPMYNQVEIDLVHVSDPVHNIFKICKLDQFAKIYN